MKKVISIAIVFSLLFSLPLQAQEELNNIFKKVHEYVEAKNFPKALEELNWAKNELSKMHNDALKGFFPEMLSGFKGEKIEVNQALGMTNLERNYKSGNALVQLSLVGGGKNSGMAGLANIGRMAALMGGGQGNGNETIRIDGKTASLSGSKTRTELSVFLDSGSVLKLETRKGNDAAKEQLKKMAKEIKLTDLDKYLSGTVS